MIGAGGWIILLTKVGSSSCLPIATADDLAYMTVTTKDGQRVRLGDGGQIVERHTPSNW